MIGVTDFYRVEGDEVHEVAVGPVHAGVIEPGHFRFQCHGENVFHLEISLGYQHRGVEKALLGGPDKRSIHYAETLAGDTTVGHATAYCQVVEALARCQKTPRAQALRGIALELERLANHVGDLGALANDVAFLPTASYCGRLRGDFLNMTATLCGSRFGRGMIRPGGVGFDVDDAIVRDLLTRLDAAERDTANAVELLWDTPSVMARFEDTGPRRRGRWPRRWAWWGPPRAPAGCRATCATIIRRGSSASHTSPSPPGAPATCSRAPTCAGSKCSGRSTSCASSFGACRRATCAAPSGLSRRTRSRWRSPKAGAASSVTSR